MAHSSGASRLALPQRAIQPGGGGVLAGVAVVVGWSAGGAGLFGAVCADLAGALDFGVAARGRRDQARTDNGGRNDCKLYGISHDLIIGLKIGQQIGQFQRLFNNSSEIPIP